MLNSNARLDAAKFRSQRIKYAVATSIAGKVVTTGVQMLAMPIAIRALGPERFALYAMLSAALTWVSLANIGVGPGLIVGIASARADGEQWRESRLFTSAFLPVLIMVLLIALVFGSVITTTPLATTFGPNYSQYESTIRSGLALLLCFTLLQSLLAVIEAVQTGYQEQYVLNLWMAAGGVLTLAALILSARLSPLVMSLILAVNLPPLLSRLLNAARFVWRRTHLIPRLRWFDWADSKYLLVTGLAFSLVGIGSFLNHQLPIIMIGRTLDPHAAANIAAVMNAFLLAFGLVSMLAAPLVPAIADSVARGEIAWAHRAYSKLLLSSMLYAGVVGLVFAVLGQLVFRLWIGASVSPSRPLVALLGLYFVLAMWEYVHYTVLLGLKRIRVPSLIYLARSLLAVVLVWLLIRRWGESGALLGLCISVIATTSWSFPYLTRLRMGGMHFETPGQSRNEELRA